MKIVGPTIRIAIFATIAIFSFLILLFMQPVVTIDQYANDEVERENETLPDHSKKIGTDEDETHWTTSTRGHKMALAVADALAPKGKLDEKKIPTPIIDDERE